MRSSARRRGSARLAVTAVEETTKLVATHQRGDTARHRPLLAIATPRARDRAGASEH
ncbi:MAG: hypothetical protein R3A10_13120 [Caldilineaceae bacterium]